MGEKIEAIEVNILSDDDVVREKMTYNTNGVDHALVNGTRLESITDDCSNSNGRPSEKDESVNNNVIDEHEHWNVKGFYNQVKSLCFPGNSRKAERQQRIQKILVSINSVEADLNQIPNDDRFFRYRCNKEMVEVILLGLAILTVIVIFMVPVILYYTGPPIPDTDESVANFFKTCVCYYIIIIDTCL